MTLRTPENMRAVLDFLCTKPNLTAAAHSIGAGQTSKLLFDWITKSSRGDPDLLIDWPTGDSPRPFHEHVLTARKHFIVIFEHQFRNEVLNGVPRTQVKDGQIVYKLDPHFVGWSDEDMVALGFAASERYLRDERGNAIPLVLNEPAPAHQKIHATKGLLPAIYGDHKTVDINARVQASVMHPRQRPVKTIEHEQPKQIEAQADAIASVDPLADKPSDTPLQRNLKMEARRVRDRAPPAGDARVVVGGDGRRHVATLPHVHDPDADLEEGLGGERVPVAPPRPAQAPRPSAQAPPMDPSNVQGVTSDGRPAVARGFRTA